MSRIEKDEFQDNEILQEVNDKILIDKLTELIKDVHCNTSNKLIKTWIEDALEIIKRRNKSHE